ncbi:hypothetical protein DIPPA_70209 [Diplonema papillatum]|nr:hypothetical protein DIPPA_70209 [Diplonema papillatum]
MTGPDIVDNLVKFLAVCKEEADAILPDGVVSFDAALMLDAKCLAEITDGRVHTMLSESGLENFANTGTVNMSLLQSPFDNRPSTILFYPADYKAPDDRTCVANIQLLREADGSPTSGAYGVSTPTVVQKPHNVAALAHIGVGAVRFGVLLATLQRAGLRLASSSKGCWSLLWAKRIKPEEYNKISAFQKVNHFPGTWGIGRKDALSRNLRALEKKHTNHFSFHPKTYVLPGDTLSLSKDMLSQKLFILKPCASACGLGIKVISTIEEVDAGSSCIVQEYITNPMLIDGYKFDLRLYVAMTSINPLRLYIYQEGMVRLASEKYPCKSQDTGNLYAHLTNYSINKNNENYVSSVEDSDDGDSASKRTLTVFRQWCASQGIDWLPIQAQINDVVVKTLLSVEDTVFMSTSAQVRSSSSCFEVFGFDLLLDTAAQVHLLEVNIMPSLNTESPVDEKIKCSLVADLLTLVGVSSGPRRKEEFVSRSRLKPVLPAEDCFPNVFWEKLDGQQQQIIMDTEEEHARRGHFDRIFPNAFTYPLYRSFFASERPSNKLLFFWEKSKLSFWETRLSRNLSLAIS